MGVLEPVLKKKVNHVLCQHNNVTLQAMQDFFLNALVHRPVPCVTEYLFFSVFEHVRRRDRAFWNVIIVVDVRGANVFNFQVWPIRCVNHLINKAKNIVRAVALSYWLVANTRSRSSWVSSLIQICQCECKVSLPCSSSAGLNASTVPKTPGRFAYCFLDPIGEGLPGRQALHVHIPMHMLWDSSV